MFKIGIIGTGRIGKIYGESILKHIKNVELKAIADTFLSNETLKWAKEIGVPNVYDNYQMILEDKEIDAVLICSSIDTRSRISIEAINSNKHVFCEKPIDYDLKRINEVIEKINKLNIKYQVGFNRRYDHNFRAIKSAILEGKIGEPHILKITSGDPEPPPIECVSKYRGIFLDMTIHDFDMVRYLLDSEVVEVYAAGNVLIDNSIGEAGDIDTAIVTLKMASGAMAIIDNSRQAAYGYDQRAEVLGSIGKALIENDITSTKVVILTEDSITSEKPLFLGERYMQPYVEEITEFIDSIINNTDVSVSADDGLKAVLIGYAATKSLHENRPVRISEIKY